MVLCGKEEKGGGRASKKEEMEKTPEWERNQTLEEEGEGQKGG